MISKVFGSILSVLTALFMVVATPLSAREFVLATDLCIGGADSVEEALALTPSDMDCSSNPAVPKSAFVRSSAVTPLDYETTREKILWQGDPAYFESMVLRLVYADDSVTVVEIDPQTATRDWFARSRFSVPVPVNASRLVAVDQVVERPRTGGIIKDARLIPEAEARDEHFTLSVLYALLCGLLLVPIVYDLLFYRLLKSRFLIWHAAMAASQLVYVLSNWGLIFHFLPDTPLYLRFHLNTIALAGSSVFAVLFVRDLLEKGTTPVWLQRAILTLVGLAAVLKAVTLLDLESLRLTAHSLFILATIPVGPVVFVIAVVALANGSKAARYLVVALLGVVVSGIFEIMSSTGILSPLFPVDDWLFMAMVLLVLGTSAAASDRFLVLRMERDRARMEATRLGRLALSDPLTGLANRRAFEQLDAVDESHCLLMADIDHFKQINDEYGHATGDAVLADLSRLLCEAFGDMKDARFFRMGGEEFAILLPCADRDALARHAEKLRSHVERCSGVGMAGIPPITVSVGGAQGGSRTVGEIFAEADQALYRSKAEGRNRSAVMNADGEIRVI